MTPRTEVHIIARLNVGGPAIHVALLGQAMQARGDDFTLVTGRIGEGEGDMSYYATDRGVEPVYVDALGPTLRPVQDIAAIFRIYRLLRRIRPDVVHTHTAKAGFVGRTAAWLARAPVVLHTFHGHVLHGYFSPAKTRLFIALERLAARVSDRIITISPRLRDALADTYRVAARDRFAVIPYGLDLSSFADAPRKHGRFREEWGIPSEAPLVGIAGRLTQIKNHALFLDAARRVHEQIPEARFAIVGDGELRAELEEQIAASGLESVVTITGWQRDMAAVYGDLDVLVISSNNEGTPFTLIEAMATGCPVVSTDVGGVADLLEEGALGGLVPPGDPDALAGAIAGVVRDPPDAERTRALTLERYTIDRLVRDLDELYAELATA